MRHPEDGLLLALPGWRTARPQGAPGPLPPGSLLAVPRPVGRTAEPRSAIACAIARMCWRPLAAPAGSPGAAWISKRADAELAAQSIFGRLANSSRRSAIRACAGRSPAPLVLALCFVRLSAASRDAEGGSGRAPAESRSGLPNRVRAAASVCGSPRAPARSPASSASAYKPAARETEIARLFQAAHYDWNDPLSAKAYSAWRDQLAANRTPVVSQPNSYDIKTTTDDSELVSATLKLRTTDLEPLEGRFEFRNRDWVEMTELVDQQTTSRKHRSWNHRRHASPTWYAAGSSRRPGGGRRAFGLLRRTAGGRRAAPGGRRSGRSDRDQPRGRAGPGLRHRDSAPTAATDSQSAGPPAPCGGAVRRPRFPRKRNAGSIGAGGS